MVRYKLSPLTKKLQGKFGPGYAIYCQQGRCRQIRAIFWAHYLKFFGCYLVAMKAAVFKRDNPGGFYCLDTDKPGDILDLLDDRQATEAMVLDQARVLLQEIEAELIKSGVDFEVDDETKIDF